ncbi:MAG: 8-oxo-dGTP pyrophosphatase MutT (NUDIX family) [Gammaproteobacteria bacterium]|jgi:8-oxo-dGTP pyrophosphatase MutT (NUDIX family)
MDNRPWVPHTTVAAICERDGRYLLVKETINGSIVYNQPAGHLEADESLVEAVVRETMEETRYQFTPNALQGIYRYTAADPGGKTYIRYLFRGLTGNCIEGALDDGIISAEGLTYDQVVMCQSQHRTPLVLQCIDDYLNNPGYPLEIFNQNYI